MYKKLIVLALAPLLLWGCQAQKVINAITPTRGYELASNLVYDADTGNKLDVYQPEGVRNAPVVLFFYGGRWQEGDKELYRFVGQALAARGYVAVLPNYRLFPEVEFPAFVEDGAAAVQWVRQQVQHYSGDPQKIFVMGHSAGAHIAALLALDGQYLSRRGLPANTLSGMIGLAGPYDFLPITAPDLKRVFAPAHPPEVSQPVNFVRRDAPPLLLLHGEDDQTVELANTIALRDATVRAGGAVETVLYPKLNHSRIVGSLAVRLEALADVLDQVDQFVRKHSGLPPLPVAAEAK